MCPVASRRLYTRVLFVNPLLTSEVRGVNTGEEKGKDKSMMGRKIRSQFRVEKDLREVLVGVGVLREEDLRI